MLHIPKILHFCWVGGGALTAQAQDFYSRWCSLHPHWDIRLWTKTNLPPMRNRELFDASDNTGHKADVLRYEVLRQFGGVYSDLDMEPIKPLETILDGVTAFAGAHERWMTSTGWQGMEIAILGAVPNHPLYNLLCDTVASNAGQHYRGGVTQRTGPEFFRDVCAEWTSQGSLGGLTVFPPDIFYPYHPCASGREKVARPDTVAVHRWAFGWQDDAGTPQRYAQLPPHHREVQETGDVWRVEHPALGVVASASQPNGWRVGIKDGLIEVSAPTGVKSEAYRVLVAEGP